MEDTALMQVGRALASLLENGQADKDGRIRVEDVLSVAGAVAGQACIRAAGEFDPDAHDFTPGAPVFSERVNMILSGGAQDWAALGIQTVFGRIHEGALAFGYTEADFPDLHAVFALYPAGVTEDDSEARWGRPPLSVAAVHAPRKSPLQSSFEARAAIAQFFAEHGVTVAGQPAVCAFALAMILGDVKGAIDPGVATRMVLETANGMSKMAPMTERHMAEASKA